MFNPFSNEVHMHITTSLRVLSTIGGLTLIGVSGAVNAMHTPDYDLRIVIAALAAGTALAAWAITPMLNTKRWLLAAFVLTCVLAGELYGFAQTGTRLLDARDARSSQLATSNQSWALRKEALDHAVAAATTECATGRGARCAAAETRVDEKRSILAGTQVPQNTNRFAALLGLAPEVFDLGLVLAGSLALNGLGFGLMTFGHTRQKEVNQLPAPVVAVTEGEPLPTDAELEQLRKLLVGRAVPLTNQEIAAKLKLSKAEASKRVSKAVRAGLVRREPRGREVAITWLH